jgi:hypothetical protein
MFINDDGRIVNLEISYMNNGKDYEVTFRSLDDTDAPVVNFDMETSAPKSRGAAKKDMFSGDNSLQVHANVRQSNDADWIVKGAQWKTQVYLPKNGIWFGSYVSDDRKDWTVVFEYKDKEVGRGTWKHGESPIWQLRDFVIFDDSDKALQSKFSVEGLKKLEYDLPRLDTDDGRIQYKIELRGDKGNALPDWITMHKFGKKYSLKFKPGLADEGKTFYFAVHLLRKGFEEGDAYPMEVTVTSGFDPNSLPHLASGDRNKFEDDFRFAIGVNLAENEIRAIDRTHFEQTLKVVNDGVETAVEIKYLYDAEAKRYEVDFQSLNDIKARDVNVAMATTVSKDDVGEWNDLLPSDSSVQVQASHRQDSEAEWVIKGSDWKTQVWIKKNNIYFSSYISNDRRDWTTTFYVNDKLLGRSVWKFGDSKVWEVPDNAHFLDERGL